MSKAHPLDQPMFDPGPAVPVAVQERPLVTARGICPAHKADPLRKSGGRVAIVEHGGHLYWSQHGKTDSAGRRHQCPASNVPLCRMPAKPEQGRNTPACMCGGR